jgi:hypothetical protein
MNKEQYQMIRALESEGVTYQDAQALRRVSMTLNRWHERECGTEHGCIERDEDTGVPYFRAAAGTRYQVRDMETGALKRLATIMARYPHLKAYVQGDPRGAALYIWTPRNVAVYGNDVDANYSRGIAVY